MDAGNGCINQQASPGSGHHNAGQDCQNGGCHNHGFTIAGTLYSSINGGNPVVGATIHVVDANGTPLDLVTMDNGNFYTSTAVTFPITVLATSCPNIQHMTATVAPGPSCNKSGCHTSTNRIHLP